MKGQLMTISVLMFVLLMAATLVAFVVIGIGYDQISGSSVLASTVGTYATVTQGEAPIYARADLQNTLGQLYAYETNHTVPGINLVSNLSIFLQYLVTNGTVPYTYSGRLINHVTLTAYNKIVDAPKSYGLLTANVTETKPIFTQTSPYSIDMSYMEILRMYSPGGNYTYTFPVSVSVPLNGTYDLFYAQQGIFAPIKFYNSSELATNIGGEYASSGNTSAFVYGTVYSVPSPSSCASLGLPAALNSPPYNSQIIIATPNASAITASGCAIANEYGGLITGYVSTSPRVPYLVFSPGSNSVLSDLQTGQQVLLYGPSLSVLNISKLVASSQSTAFLKSPFAPDYLQRTMSELYGHSPYGLVAIPWQLIQSGYFDGSDYLEANYTQAGTTNYTVTAWVKTTAAQGTIIGSPSDVGLYIGPSCGGAEGAYCSGSSAGVPAVGIYNTTSGTWVGVNGNYIINDGRWHFIAATFSGFPLSDASPSDFKLYVDGMQVAGASSQTGTIPVPLYGISGSGNVMAGYDGHIFLNGMMSNVQVYNETLTPSDIQALYLNGIQSLPETTPNASQLGLELWLPLNGGTSYSDYSGLEHRVESYYTGTPSSYVSFPLTTGYTRDALMPSSAYMQTYPVPGIGSCSNAVQCVNATYPNFYLGDEPFQDGSGTVTAAYFNGRTSYMEPTAGFNSLMSASQPFSASVWVYPTSSNGIILEELGQTTPGTGWHYSMLEMVSGQLYVRIPGGSCIGVGSVPAGSWSSIVLAYSGSAYSVYINGAMASSGSAARTAPNTGGSEAYYPLGISDATNNCGSGAAFSGMMSDYQFYNSSLTQQEASSIFTGGLTGVPVDMVHLIGWWPLNGNSDDYSGMGNVGAANSIGYVYVGYNASPSSSQYQSGQGLQTSGSSGVWQALGFGAPSVQKVLWNVTAWQLPTGAAPLTYNTVSSAPANAVTSYSTLRTGGWYSGIEGGYQQWSFGLGGYAGSFSDMPVSPFPGALNLLNSYVNCASGSMNATFYSAQATMHLSGSVTFQIVADDEMAVFYRKVGTTSWSSVFGSGPWNGQVTGPYNPGPTTVAFSPASYQVVVDWSNLCAGGLSSFAMS